MMASKIQKPIIKEKYQYYELNKMRAVVDYK